MRIIFRGDLMSFNRKYMERAIELAKKGAGAVNPNPLVGAVIVKNGKIIGEGYHAKYGDLHAERAAFANIIEDATGAEMYVTLEPCCHHGKQPPCVEAIVEHNISKVYVGSDDPNEMVAGKGIKYLKEHGIDVETQVMKAECDALNDVFFHYITTGLPYVVMKYAMTMDGKIATYSGKSKWVSNEASRKLVQETRKNLFGIMVGIGTVLADNPMLTCRIPDSRNPVRIVCDTKLRIPVECNLVKTAKEVKTIVATSKNAPIDKIALLQELGVIIIQLDEKDGHIDLKKLMIKLGEMKIDGILLEGGGTVNYSALCAGIVNEVQVYIAPKIFGGGNAPSPVEGLGVDDPSLSHKFRLKATDIIDGDVLLKYTK